MVGYMIKKIAIYVVAIVIIISAFAYRHYQNPSIKRPTGNIKSNSIIAITIKIMMVSMTK